MLITGCAKILKKIPGPKSIKMTGEEKLQEL